MRMGYGVYSRNQVWKSLGNPDLNIPVVTDVVISVSNTEKILYKCPFLSNRIPLVIFYLKI